MQKSSSLTKLNDQGGIGYRIYWLSLEPRDPKEGIHVSSIAIIRSMKSSGSTVFQVTIAKKGVQTALLSPFGKHKGRRAVTHSPSVSLTGRYLRNGSVRESQACHDIKDGQASVGHHQMGIETSKLRGNPMLRW